MFNDTPSTTILHLPGLKKKKKGGIQHVDVIKIIKYMLFHGIQFVSNALVCMGPTATEIKAVNS